MLAYVLRRLTQSVFVLFGLVTFVFFLARVTGDPTDLYLPLTASNEQRVAFREEHGFDRPLGDQYVDFLRDVAQLDFGTSLWLSAPALDAVIDRLPHTLMLATITVSLSVALALVLGSLCALSPFSRFDRVVSLIGLFGVSVADFWLALMLIIVFAVELQILPTSGTGDWRYFILPVLTLALPLFGRMLHVVRVSVGEQLSAGYVTTAYAKGLRTHQTVFRHVLRNAFLPVLTVAGIQLVGLVNGAVIVETVFGWPGIGKLTVDAISRRDFPIIQASVFVVAVMTFGINLIVDLCYAVVDPRIRFR